MLSFNVKENPKQWGGVKGRKNIQPWMKPVAFLAVFLLMFYLSIPKTSNNMILLKNRSPVSAKQLRSTASACSKMEMPFAIIADLDEKSKTTGKKGKFQSYFTQGVLASNCNADQSDYEFDVSWSSNETLFSGINSGGRGFELSELAQFNDKLYSFDDRTGIVYEIVKTSTGAHKAIQRHIITEGNGVDSSKGKKIEWATVKDNNLYVGSTGKDFTDDNGNVVHSWNKWIAVCSNECRKVDWTSQYDKVRDALGVSFPGYVVHEAVEWSEVRKQWIFLPRRVSNEAYDEKLDEVRGSNHVVLANEDFSTIEVKQIGSNVKTQGFSSFKFLPNTDDKIVLAVKSEENAEKGTQSSYLSVFHLDTGKVYIDAQLIDEHIKYEGLSFL